MTHEGTSSTTVQVPPVSRIEKTIESILKIFVYLSAAFYFVMMTITVVHVIGRYVFRSPIVAILDYSGFLMASAIFLSIAYVTTKKRHISVDMLTAKLPKKAREGWDFIIYLAIMAFSVLAAWLTIEEGLYQSHSGLIATSSGWPVYPFYLIIGLGWALFAVTAMIRIVNCLRGMVQK